MNDAASGAYVQVGTDEWVMCRLAASWLPAYPHAPRTGTACKTVIWIERR